MIGLGQYMLLGALLFGIGLFGVVYKKNAIAVLMCLELMLNAVNINFIAISRYSALAKSSVAQLFALMVIVVAAAEVAVGLAMLIAIYRQKKSVHIDEFNILKW
jgi:NADH-quinone oxidoreductase subunit K